MPFPLLRRQSCTMVTITGLSDQRVSAVKPSGSMPCHEAGVFNAPYLGRDGHEVKVINFLPTEGLGPRFSERELIVEVSKSPEKG